MPKCDFNKFALQLYWNRTSVWVFSCEFAAYFQNTSRWLLLTVSVVENEMLKIAGFINSFMMEAGLDWFLYDNGLRHERVNIKTKK